MEFKAFKMDGLGNDFVIIDQRVKAINLSKENIVKICSRDFIGCDQLIYINKNEDNKDKLVFYNSDGSISGACGNGTRCVAKLLSKEYGKDEINVETSSGNLHSQILKENLVETNIGIPSIEWDKIPLIKEMNTKNLNITINDINGKKFTGGIAIHVGNPHIIFFVENNDNYYTQNQENVKTFIEDIDFNENFDEIIDFNTKKLSAIYTYFLFFLIYLPSALAV